MSKTPMEQAMTDYSNGDVPSWAVDLRAQVIELMRAHDELYEQGASQAEIDRAERDYDAACELLRKELEFQGWKTCDQGPSYLDDEDQCDRDDRSDR